MSESRRARDAAIPELPVKILRGRGQWTGEFRRRLGREILPPYVPTCRWFGGKGRTVREFKIVQDVPIGTLREARLVVIEVAFAEGPSESYVLPLMLVDDTAGRALAVQTPLAVLGQFADRRVLCDAIHVAEVRAELLRLMVRPAPNRARVRLTGRSRGDLDAAAVQRALAQSRVTSADQSNTSVIYGGTWFMKLFRKFERGPNPDLEVTQFLSEGRGFPHVPRYLGSLQLADPEGDSAVALLADFTPNRGDAWTFTLASLARYFQRVLASRARPSAKTAAAMIGEGYPRRARQLGVRTGGMHLALASGEDRPEFAAEPFTKPDQRALCQSLRRAATGVLQQVRRQTPRLPEALRSQAAELTASQSRLFAVFGRLLTRPIPAWTTRVHGDYHLGQVLNTGKDFVIIDFEGEPKRALAERRRKRSPLVDVAGMLRSFDYAGAVALRQQNPKDAARLAPWARAWVETISAQFLEAYFATIRAATFLPPEAADVKLLLEVFILEKAVYEIGYEVSYRPDFLPIPLRAVLRLLAETGSAPASH
jgi:maltose alpha-D-glucosyltransferase/alpha-amylase